MYVKLPRTLLLLPILLSTAPLVTSAQFVALSRSGDHLSPSMLGGAPPNGPCAGAVVAPLEMGVPSTVTGNNENAPTEPIFQANVVWEGFSTTACADVMVSYCGTDPDFLGGMINLVTGCPITNVVFNSASNIVPNECGDGNFGVRFLALPPGTYYYPVLEAPGSSGDYTLVFTATPCTGTPPSNALCTGAIPLTPADTCVHVSGTVEHATNVGPTGTACGNGDISDGVWYSFVANSHSCQINVVPSADFNVHLSLISGSCSAQNLLACAIGQNFGAATTLSATGLVPGSTYFVRVADWYAGVPRTSTFDICVVEVVDTECEAAAGNLVPDQANVCFTGPSTTISAIPSGNANVPPGYSTVFLLTSSSEVVLAQSGQPLFTVSGTGGYSIRTLVYDPVTFDPATIQLGSNTIGSLNELFVQGGGPTCASLDITGAGFTVENCCTASTGTLVATSPTVCWDEPVVAIGAVAGGDASVPVGQVIRYLLSTAEDGLVRDTSTTPTFNVSSAGSYRIHTLVFDPNTYPLGTIALDTTTIATVAGHFLSGGGSQCGALDQSGALIEVVTCCPGTLGSLAVVADTLCQFPTGSTFVWTLEGADVPAGYTVRYLIADAQGTIADTTTAMSTTLTGIGTHRVHALILDTLTFDLGAALDTSSTVHGLNALLVQGGGAICALLDTAGTILHVVDCRPGNDDCSTPEFVTVQLPEACAGGLVHGDNTHATQGDAPAPGCSAPGSEIADVWYLFNSGENTGITVLLDPGSMTAWGIAIQDVCNGTELLCVDQPSAPVDLDLAPNTALLLRIFTDRNVGQPGEFTLCVTGAVTSAICDAGSVASTDGQTLLNVCQDIVPDLIEFTTTSTAPVNYTYVVTGTDSMIAAVIAEDALDFNGLAVGTYLVHGLSHDGALSGISVGDRLSDITTTGQCLQITEHAAEVRVEVCNGVEESGGASWAAWPNPGNGRINVVCGQAFGPATVRILGPDGRLLHEQQVMVDAGIPITVDLPVNSPSGMYLVRILTADGMSDPLRIMVQ